MRIDIKIRLASGFDAGHALYSITDALNNSDNVTKYEFDLVYEMLIQIKNARLEQLRTELRAERISYGELLELQSLAEYIDKDDVELLEAAGINEY